MDPLSLPPVELVMRDVRRGTVLLPEALQSALRGLKERKPMTERALALAVPNWLVDAFERQTATLLLRLAVFPTVDGADKLLTVTLQCDSAQLRIALLLSEPAVQEYLADAVPAGRLCFVLGIEHSTQNAAMAAGLSEEEARWLRQNAIGARPGPMGLAPAVQLAIVQTHPSTVPSLVDGQPVRDVVSALVTNQSQVDISAAIRAAILPLVDDSSEHATRH